MTIHLCVFVCARTRHAYVSQWGRYSVYEGVGWQGLFPHLNGKCIYTSWKWSLTFITATCNGVSPRLFLLAVPPALGDVEALKKLRFSDGLGITFSPLQSSVVSRRRLVSFSEVMWTEVIWTEVIWTEDAALFVLESRFLAGLDLVGDWMATSRGESPFLKSSEGGLLTSFEASWRWVRLFLGGKALADVRSLVCLVGRPLLLSDGRFFGADFCLSFAMWTTSLSLLRLVSFLSGGVQVDCSVVLSRFLDSCSAALWSETWRIPNRAFLGLVIWPLLEFEPLRRFLSKGPSTQISSEGVEGDLERLETFLSVSLVCCIAPLKLSSCWLEEPR